MSGSLEKTAQFSKKHVKHSSDEENSRGYVHGIDLDTDEYLMEIVRWVMRHVPLPCGGKEIRLAFAS